MTGLKPAAESRWPAFTDALGRTWRYDLGAFDVVRAITDRVLVMDAGRIVEEGPTGRILSQPLHPVTRRLVAAAPILPPA